MESESCGFDAEAQRRRGARRVSASHGRCHTEGVAHTVNVVSAIIEHQRRSAVLLCGPLRLCASASKTVHTKLICILVLITTSAFAGDWPGILGPDRNGVADGETLLTAWPESGPAVVWERPVGEGFAGVAVVDGRAFLFDRVDGENRAAAFVAGTGRPIWERRFPTDFTTGFSDDDGPRCTPVVAGEHVYLYGPQGRLRCLAAETGEPVWERDTHGDFAAPEGYFGAGSTPIVEGDLVIVNVGGRRENAGVVAFDRLSGKTKWAATMEAASYSSPIAVTIDGTRQLIAITRLKCISLDPETGKVRFEFDFGARGPTVNAASPVVLGDRLFVTAHYRVGAVYGTISADGFEETWRSDDVLSSHYTTPIAHEGKLYGIDGQERLDPGTLRCVDPATKRVLWSVDDFGYAGLVRAGDLILAMQTTGDLVLFEANPEKYVERARARVAKSTSRAMPALANGLLYVRDGETLRCLRVGTEAKAD